MRPVPDAEQVMYISGQCFTLAAILYKSAGLAPNGERAGLMAASVYSA